MPDPEPEPPPAADGDEHTTIHASAAERLAAPFERLDGGLHPGARVGPFRLLSLLGEGGFGEVWLAERREPFVQRVALKIIKPGMDSRAVIARFEQERQALAVMDHPSVARVLDGGITPPELGSRPYFVMEHVQGEPITAFCDLHTYTIGQRLELFTHVCEAVQHAHHKGIIHRDLKPANILVTLKDDRAIPKVIDFGVAKAMSHTLTDRTVFTETGQLIGTPEYMSPEQAEMSSLDIDTRTDVYSLGVVLYELLAGVLPFDSRTLRSAGIDAIRRIIREQDAPRPSTRLSTIEDASASAIAARRQSARERLSHVLQHELEWIPLKALRKDRTRRYTTPAELAADIRRYLNGEPLEAAPESTVYRTRKFLSRHRRPAAAAGAALLALCAGLALATWQWRAAVAAGRRADEQADLARRQAERAEAVVGFVKQALIAADPNESGVEGLRVAEAMERAVALVDAGSLADQPETEASLRLTISEVLGGNAQPARALTQAEHACEILDRLHPGDHPARAAALAQAAEMLRLTGRAEQAEPRLRAALDMHRRLATTGAGQRDDAAVAGATVLLAQCVAERGRYAESLGLFTEALEMNQRLFPGDHSSVASGLGHIATAMHKLGRADEAVRHAEQSLAMRRRLHPRPADHPAIATALHNLATYLAAGQRWEQALATLQEALAMEQRLFPSRGDAHPDIASTLDNIGLALGNLGRRDESIGYHRRALDARRRIYPGDHPEIALSLHNLAFSLCDLKRDASEYLPLYEEALAMRRRLYTGDHPLTALTLNNIGASLLDASRMRDAQPYLDEALAMRRRLHGKSDHEELVRSLRVLASNLRWMERYDEALPYAIEADAMARRILPESDATRQHCARTLQEIRSLLQGVAPR